MSLADFFKSDAERKVDMIYGSGDPATTLNSDAQIFAAASSPLVVQPDFPAQPSDSPEPDQSRISFFDALIESVTPESYGESVVNQIYSDPKRTLLPDPAYNVQDLSSPNVYVAAKGAVSNALNVASSFGKNALLIGLGVLLLVVAVYALVPALVRR